MYIPTKSPPNFERALPLEDLQDLSFFVSGKSRVCTKINVGHGWNDIDKGKEKYS
jgi:hypothetical protein